eukprot:scaffold36573_cov19-Tisochrysis_lutea.AAC.1
MSDPNALKRWGPSAAQSAGATPDPDHGSEGGLSNRQSTTDLGRSLGRDRWAIQDIDGLMYSSFDLYSPTRKVTQAYFLIQKAQDLKIEFNNEWERLSKQKASDMDKVGGWVKSAAFGFCACTHARTRAQEHTHTHAHAHTYTHAHAPAHSCRKTSGL